ncbi:MAG: electron transfer flavoprotein subunit beta/FixA family protein [Anaerolineaceae bacterium]|nr:electron transfer flavoprotein subunit beta/FixA family protein [Anaerolineaceae bacterium]
MRIIVPIKQVPETSKVKMDPETGTMIRKGLASVVNPLDLYAVETALDLRESMGGKVTVITMGPPNAKFALREALAMGCDDAILLSSRAFAGADTWATSYVLIKAIQKLGDVDLIICGERATDGDTGQVGPAIASWLNLPLATYVNAVKIPENGDPGDGLLHIERMVEDGIEHLSTPLPAVLTVIKEVPSPRFPTLQQKLDSLDAEITVWGPEDIDAIPENLGLKGSPTRVVKISQPKVTRKAELVYALKVDDVGRAARKVVEILKTHNLI